MKTSALLAQALLAGSLAAGRVSHGGRRDRLISRSRMSALDFEAIRTTPHPARQGPIVVRDTRASDKYKVDGNKIPDVDFDIGPSWAGLMPIGDSKDRELYFWFFPAENSTFDDDLVIWLNGGPGCSSLEGT